jgi:uncharacterized membrane protein
MYDTHRRSVVKGITWRLVGSVDTAVLSYFFTGQSIQAAQIATAELVSKIGLYYLHERLWTKLNLGRRPVRMQDGSMAFVEQHWRSVLKGTTWRITGTLDTIFWAALITGHMQLALKIGAAEVLTKILLYYLHERLWMLISWGRKPHNLIPEKEVE